MAGNLSEQFRDQLRLAIHLDPERASQKAHKCLAEASKAHIRRLARWMVERMNPTERDPLRLFNRLEKKSDR